VIVGEVALLLLGLALIWHAAARCRSWAATPDRPLRGPWMLLSYRLPRPGVTERDLEHEGTVAEGLVGAAIVAGAIFLLTLA
jgi:hypothetical protein